MTTEIKNVRVDAKGLKKLVDYLHSDENIHIMGSADNQKHFVFVLEQVNYMGRGILDWYSVNLSRRFGNEAPDEYFSKLTELLKDCYKK